MKALRHIVDVAVMVVHRRFFSVSRICASDGAYQFSAGEVLTIAFDEQGQFELRKAFRF